MDAEERKAWLKNLFKLNRPNTWLFVMPATATSSRVPEDEKWCNFKEASFLFSKEFTPHYYGAADYPSWDHWMKHGLWFDLNSTMFVDFKEMAELYTREQIEKLLKQCQPKYVAYKAPEQEPPDPYARAVPMPGAGKANPKIKDIKGERLS